MGKKVLIAGAGLGGLATAMRLSFAGYDVEIVEKYHQAGGRLNQLKKDGFTFDVGPSFFSMSYEFDELFASCGISNPLIYEELDPLYSVFFSGKSEPYNIYKNLQKLAEEFRGVEADFEAKAEKYLAQAKKIFHDTEYKVVKKNFKSVIHYLLSLSSVPLQHLPKLYRNMWKELEMHFKSEEVKVIFSLVSFFLGATPFNTPSVYSLLNYTELQHDGYWNIKGGMYSITEKISGILKERGVTFHFNTEITNCNYNGKKISGLVDSSGKEWNADIFVINADAAAFRGQVLKKKKFTPQKLDKMHWTLSPFTIYLGIQGKVEKLNHHNYFLGNNFREYADTIFSQSVSPEKPYYYVNVPSKTNPECAPDGCENIFILCPVPDLRFKPDWADTEKLAENIIEDLAARTGFNLKANTITKTIWNPADWEQKFNLYKGSGLGLAHGMNQIGGFRPANKDENYKNLYYVGASTVPGTGLPMVVIGSKLVTERIREDDGIVR